MFLTISVWYHAMLDCVLGIPVAVKDDVRYETFDRLSTSDDQWADVVRTTRYLKRPRWPFTARAIEGFKIVGRSSGCRLSLYYDFLLGESVSEARADYQRMLNLQLESYSFPEDC